MPLKRRNFKRNKAVPVAKKKLTGDFFSNMGDREKRAYVKALGLQNDGSEGFSYKGLRELSADDLQTFARVCNNPDSNVERVYRERIKSPLTAIRAFCVECVGGLPNASTKCENVTCVLWAFKHGKNPFFQSSNKPRNLNFNKKS